MSVTKEQIGVEIIKVASRFVGLTEIKSNATWDDLSTPGVDPRANELRSLLLSTKWPLGAAYCIAFAEAAWVQAYKNLNASPGLIAEISNKFTPSVILTYRNWGKAIQRDPIVGSVFFWEKGNSGTGHAGIVRSIDDYASNGVYLTIEGNTAAQSTTVERERNGDGVYERIRTTAIGRAPKSQGFWLRGFLQPIGWE